MSPETGFAIKGQTQEAQNLSKIPRTRGDTEGVKGNAPGEESDWAMLLFRAIDLVGCDQERGGEDEFWPRSGGCSVDIFANKDRRGDLAGWYQLFPEVRRGCDAADPRPCGCRPTRKPRGADFLKKELVKLSVGNRTQ